MLTIFKSFEFEAAHRLPKHRGACKYLHGHSYKLEVGISGPVDINTGMIIDFKSLKGLVNEIVIDRLDHSYLNELIMISNFPAECLTAENMVIWIVNQLKGRLRLIDPSMTVTVVRLWETSGSYCEWREEK